MAWNDIDRRGPRMMGETKRWHTWPTVQQQTVADHQWHVLRIYDAVFGLDSVETVRYVMHHDSPESWTGDIPFHAKRGIAGMREAAAEGEVAFCAAHNIADAGELTGENVARLKIADLLEMFEFSMREAQLGNAHGRHVMNTTWLAVKDLLWRLSAQQQAAVGDWVIKRLAEHELAMSTKLHDSLSNFWKMYSLDEGK